MGKETSLYLSRIGVDVVLAARRVSVLQELEKDIRQKFGTDPLAISVDVSSENDVKNMVDSSIDKFGKIDFVVNYAGNPIGYVKGYRRKAIYEQTIEHLKEIAEVDHFGSVRVLEYVLPYMIKEKFGIVILISSSAAVYGYSEDIDYIPIK